MIILGKSLKKQEIQMFITDIALIVWIIGSVFTLLLLGRLGYGKLGEEIMVILWPLTLVVLMIYGVFKLGEWLRER